METIANNFRFYRHCYHACPPGRVIDHIHMILLAPFYIFLGVLLDWLAEG